MSDVITWTSLFVAEVVCTYFFSRALVHLLYLLLSRKGRNHARALYLLAILYFPGTVIHEISHYFMAVALFMKPGNIRIFPQIDEKGATLGGVEIYHSKAPFSFLRNIIVGIAPFIGAMSILWIISSFQLFPSDSFVQVVFVGYGIFVVSSQMFSSMKDLAEAGYLVPFFLIVGIILYIFQVQIEEKIVTIFFKHIVLFIQTIQTPLLFSLGLHAILIGISSLLLRFYDKSSIRPVR